MNPDCLFCQIANGQTDTKLVWENDIAAAFADNHPQAPIHLLVVPKQHVESLDTLNDAELAGQLLEVVRLVANEAGVAGGYRVQINVGKRGGQLIDHLHFHVMGGKRFSA